MTIDQRTKDTESDMHGEPCDVCDDAPSVADIYVINPDGDVDTRNTCVSPACIDHVVACHHHSDTIAAVVEVSTAPLPWLLALGVVA